MITYEAAKAKALKLNSKIDSMKEYESAYVFYNSKAEGAEAVDNEVVVMKDTGKTTNYAEYVTTTKDSDKPIRSIYDPKGLK